MNIFTEVRAHGIKAHGTEKFVAKLFERVLKLEERIRVLEEKKPKRRKS